MKTITYYSCLSREIDRFVELRRLSGTDYSSQARLLVYFDRFLIEQYPNELTISRHITDHYLQSIFHTYIHGVNSTVLVLFVRYVNISLKQIHAAIYQSP